MVVLNSKYDNDSQMRRALQDEPTNNNVTRG